MPESAENPEGDPESRPGPALPGEGSAAASQLGSSECGFTKIYLHVHAKKALRDHL